MEQMLVTKALNELKLLDARITRKVSESDFVTYAKTSAGNVKGKVSKETYKSNAKADFTSITDLIKRRNVIKAALIQSNAVTMVEVAGKKMTVAEAIDKKEAISYEKQLLNQLSMQYTRALDQIHIENSKVDDNIDTLLMTAYGKENKDKINQTSYDAIAVPYRQANEFSLVDALESDKLIKKMKDEIESFESEVDTCLQISNSTTMMELNL